MNARESNNLTDAESGNALLSESVATQIAKVIRGPSEKLPATIRHRMESWFDQDLSQVRIYTGLGAAASANALQAQAFTIGRHIVFASGNFRPSSDADYWLLAHELVHALQQQLKCLLNTV